MNDPRTKQIEQAISATLSKNRMMAPVRKQHEVGNSDVTKRVPVYHKRDPLHNEIFGMFGSLANTEIIF